MPALKIPRYDDNCALCRVVKADKTGSHLAPNFLIHGAFSFDGKGGRFREIVTRDNLNMQSRWLFYGQEVSPEAISADRGRSLTDEELEGNINVLECDNLFCSRCEARFALLESEYAKFYRGEKTAVNARVAYLFWISVFWRMGVGRMSIFLDGEDEFAMREILDRRITSASEICGSSADMGDFGYVLWRTKGIRKGFSGIFGTRTEHSPYMVIVNDMVVMLLSGVSRLKGTVEYAGWEIALDSINTYRKPEVLVNEISLEEFARLKRFVLDESLEAGWGRLSEMVKLDCRERDRSSGKLHSVEKEAELIEAAKLVDGELGRPELIIRNLDVFFFGDVKRHWFARKGEEYDILEDENIMIFPFDIENYKSDLRRYNAAGRDISGMPMVDVFMPEKFWKGKRGYSKSQKDMEKFVGMLVAQGYTDNDIGDNLRSKENE